MSTVDNRIVNMHFNNDKFERGISETMSSLEQLNRGLDMKGAGAGLDSMGDSLEQVSNRFSTMGIIGMTVLQDLTRYAMSAGKSIASSLFTPIFEGGKRRALNIEAAKFQFEGLGMDIDASMKSANKAVLGTAYGLDEAAKVASQLGASGMRAGDDMTSALRAVSGVAAMTNSSYDDMGRIFTTVAGNGRLMGQQLLQLSGRGLNAAAALADEMGVTEAAVREMVSEGAIDFETFYKAMDKAFGKHATSANQTFTGSLSNMKAALSRLGESIYTPALVNLRDIFNALQVTFDGVHDLLRPLIDRFTEMHTVLATKVVKSLESIDFKQLEAGAKPTSALAKIFKGLTTILGIFGKTLGAIGKVVWSVVKAFSPLGKILLEIGGAVADVLVYFSDLISESGVLTGVVKVLTSAVKPLGAIFDTMARGISKALRSVTDSIVGVGKTDTKGVKKVSDEVVTGFKPLTTLGKAISAFANAVKDAFRKLIPVLVQIGNVAGKALGKVGQAISGLFTDGGIDKVTKLMKAGTLTALGTSIAGFFNRVGRAGEKKSIFDGINDILSGLKDVLTAFQSDIKAGTLMKIAGAVALLTASVVVLSSLDAKSLMTGLAGVGALLGELMIGLTIFSKALGTMKMGDLVKSTIAVQGLAIAIGILAVSLRAVSKLSWEELFSGLIGLSSMLGMLILSARGLSKVSGNLIGTSVGLIAFATGVRILVSSVSALAKIDTETMTQGLLTLGSVLLELAAFMKLTQKGGLSVSTGVSIMGVAVAVKILSKAVAEFSSVSAKGLVKGVGAVGVVLAELAIFSRIMKPDKMISMSIGLIGIGSAMNIFAKAVGAMGNQPWKTLVKGLGTMAGAMGILAVGLRMMPKGIIVTATGLIVMGKALTEVAKGLESFSGMDPEQVAVGLFAMAGSLSVLAAALNLTKGTLGAATALTVLAAALGLLVPSLVIFGNMSIENIAKSLFMLGGALTILGGTAVILSPLAPGLLALSAAMGVFGVSVAAIGGGMLAFGTGMTAMAAAGTAGISVLVGAFTGVVELIPLAVLKVGEGIMELLRLIAKSGIEITDAVITILRSTLQAIKRVAPEFKEAAVAVILNFLEGIREVVPEVIALGIDMVFMLLSEIADSAKSIVYVGANIIMEFMRGIRDKFPELIDTAFETIIAFINGLAHAIEYRMPELMEAGWNLVKGILKGITNGFKNIFSKGGEIAEKVKEGAKSKVKDFAQVGKDMMEGMRGGISSMAGRLGEAAKNVASSVKSGVENFLQIESPSKVFRDIGIFTGEGMIVGLDSMSSKLYEAGEDVGEEVHDGVDDSLEWMNDDLKALTITPILDDSELVRGLDALSDSMDKTYDVSGAFSSTAARAQAAASSVESFKDEKEAKDVTFVQNNYSPKALSQVEIYRNTKRQVDMLKGVV